MSFNPLNVLQPLTDLVNVGFQAWENDKNRKQSQEQFDRMLEYNTPANQRARMEAAGFNPNLVYGNGSVANTSPAPNVPQQKAPQSNMGQAVIQMLQYQNLEKQNQNLDAENARIKATTEGMNIRNDADREFLKDQRLASLNSTQLQNLLSTKTQESQIQVAQENSRQATLTSKRMIWENDHLDENQKAKLTEVAARVQNLSASSSVSEMTAYLQAADLELRKNGLSINDPLVVRILSKMLPDGFDLQKFINNRVYPQLKK